MGVPEFYLNSLPDHRRDTLEFMLSVYRYVLEKKNPPTFEPQLPLPKRYHPQLSADIGDAVLLYVLQFNQQRDFAIEINAISKMLQNEQQSELPSIRDHVLRLANEHIIVNHLSPFVDKPSPVHLGFRDFLLYFVNQYCAGNNVKKGNVEKLREAITSPAMNQLRKLIEFYAMHLHHQKDAKSYIQFYACICALLMRIDDLQMNEYVFQVLGEAENVINKYEDCFPGYTSLDNFAKFRKLLLNGKVQQISN